MRLRHIEVIQALLQTGHLGTAAEWLQLPVTEVEERLREAERAVGVHVVRQRSRTLAGDDGSPGATG
jgi:DNA-binding transcriptional LysR family regulator